MQTNQKLPSKLPTYITYIKISLKRGEANAKPGDDDILIPLKGTWQTVT